MTFVFDATGAMVFFLCYLALLCICFAGMQRYEEVGRCSVHPNTDQCAHRKRKE